MKKIIVKIMVIALLVGFSSCASKNVKSNPNDLKESPCACGDSEEIKMGLVNA